VLAKKFGYPYIVEVRKGEGGMIFIADSSFLLNRNLEGMDGYLEGNIMFLRSLFEKLLGGTPADSTMTDERGRG
ncbi:MAG: hypothetical protein KAX38_00090, partial [Candidatus Krumholzibacteria bacterium]|nr:hypothetical protein [Candidatus Krumholzibacteria bacterium]